MKRDLYHKLAEWNRELKRQPLLLQGARQVGKTFLLKEFEKPTSNVVISILKKLPQLRLFLRGI